jgi:hypothetical protein
MEETKVINVDNVQEIGNALAPDFATGTGLHDYHVALHLNGYIINLDISSSPGGNVEGGYESTSIRAALPAHPGFVFVLYPEDFLNRLGKLFGLQDVVLGYTEFDKDVIVKTDDPEKLKTILSDADVRQVFQNQSGWALKLDNHEDREEDHYLDLSIQRAITNLPDLQRILNAFYSVLVAV